MKTTLELLLMSTQVLQERLYGNDLTMDEVKFYLDRTERDVQESINTYEGEL